MKLKTIVSVAFFMALKKLKKTKFRMAVTLVVRKRWEYGVGEAFTTTTH